MASAANGDMSVDMKTTSVKMIRTRLVVEWRSGLGTNVAIPSAETKVAGGQHRLDGNRRNSALRAHPEQYGR